MRLLDKFKADDLLKHAAILFSGMAVVHVCNILFQMAVGRVLPKEEYVLLAAFLSVVAMIQRPLGTLGISLSHYSSILHQEGRTGDVKRLLKKWLLLISVPALICSGIVLVFNDWFAAFFHLDRLAPVLILGAVLPALFLIPVLSGSTQGLQAFKWNAGASISNAMTRLFLGGGFVWFLYPACGWAMLGHGLGLYVLCAVLFVGLMLSLHSTEKTTEKLPSMRIYLMQNVLIQAGFVVLMTSDVVLVKHYFPADTEFAYAATLGRLVIFLPGAIVASMFPKVASKGSGSKEQYSIFIRSFKITALLVAVAVVGCFLFSGLLVHILFGIADASDYLRQMVGLMALVMGLSALLNVIMQFFVAQRRFVPASSVLLFAVVYIVGTFFFHSETNQIILISGICNGGALLCCLVALVKNK